MILISIIIPTCNRPDYLKLVLRSICRQTFKASSFEVIVVDNCPSDSVAKVVNSFIGEIANLRYFREPSPGLHNARHRGMHEARSELLVYIDDDIEALPGWLEGVWKGFTSHDAILVGGRNLPKWEVEPPEWLKNLWTGGTEGKRCLGYLSILDFGDLEKDIEPSNVWGCNFSIRKSVLLESGGFHPDSMPDDMLRFRGDGESYVTSYISARGYRSVYIPSATVYHFVPKDRMTLEYFRQRAFRQGVSDSYSRLRKDPVRIKDAVVTSHPLRVFMSFEPMRQLLSSFLPAGVALRATVNEAYLRGFRWHKQLFQDDESVREWVLRENYLDA